MAFNYISSKYKYFISQKEYSKSFIEKFKQIH